MNRPTKVEALPGFRIRVVYASGTEGVIDLSGDVGRGVFAPLADEAFFRTVHVGQFGQIACPRKSRFALMPPTTRSRATRQPRQSMPEVSRFYGIIVRFYDRDRRPTSMQSTGSTKR